MTKLVVDIQDTTCHPQTDLDHNTHKIQEVSGITHQTLGGTRTTLDLLRDIQMENMITHTTNIDKMPILDTIEAIPRVLHIDPPKTHLTKRLNRAAVIEILQVEEEDIQALLIGVVDIPTHQETEINTQTPLVGGIDAQTPLGEAAATQGPLEEEEEMTQILLAEAEAVADFRIDHQVDKDLVTTDMIHPMIMDDVHQVAHQETMIQILTEEIETTVPQIATKVEDIVDTFVVTAHQEEKLRVRNRNSNHLYSEETLKNTLGGDVDFAKQ